MIVSMKHLFTERLRRPGSLVGGNASRVIVPA